MVEIRGFDIDRRSSLIFALDEGHIERENRLGPLQSRPPHGHDQIIWIVR